MLNIFIKYAETINADYLLFSASITFSEIFSVLASQILYCLCRSYASENRETLMKQSFSLSSDPPNKVNMIWTKINNARKMTFF